MKKILSLILAVAIVLCAVPFGAFTLTASAATSGTTGDCTWTLEGKVLTISGNGAIGGNLPSCTKVIIEDGVTGISDYAFKGHSNLMSVSIPDSVITIGREAFISCSSLTLVNIPDSVTYIGLYAFDNTEYVSDDSNYDGDLLYIDNHLIDCRDSAKGEIVVKNGTITIAGGAFHNRGNITSVLLPGSVVGIGDRSFYNCISLKDITIPSSVRTIGSSAFDGCPSLENIWYGSVKEDKVNIDIDYYNETLALTSISWHYNICNYDKHKYLADCDSSCENCEWTRTPTIEHNYDNACDDTCNDCQNTRIPEEHKYKNDCDIDCEVCGDIRTPKAHKYTNNCDTTCNECGDIRTITHTYANSCDASCNVCGDIREITHTYSNVCDSSCNVCGKTRTVPDCVYTSTCDTTCNECGSKRQVKTHKHEDCFNGYVEEIYGTWEINITQTGVYELKPNRNYTGEYNIHSIRVFDANSNEVKFNDSNGGFPLLNNQQYTVKFRYDCSEEITGTITWTKTKKADTIFSDTDKNGWYNDAVTYAVGAGIITGYGGTTKFGTADNIQRQDFLVILARLDGVDLQDYNYKSRFPDVERGSYYEAAVNWGVEKGIVNGYDNGKFGVGDKVTREQLVTFLYRYANHKGIDTSVTTAEKNRVKNKYDDFKNVSDFAKDAILWAATKGVINGKTDKTIVPHGNAQRCEVAKIMYNIYLNNIF